MDTDTYGWGERLDGWTYREGSWAHMGGEVLLEGPSGTELITGCNDPEAHSWVFTNPTMDLVIFVLT